MLKVWKQIVMGVALILAGLIVGEAQISVPHTLTNPVTVSQLNTNFSTIAGGALNRAGGTITGNITVSNGVTIDGVDISAALGAAADQTFDTLTLANTGASALDVAGGINAGSGNVGIVDTTGKIPALSSTYLANLSGANLTSLNGTNVSTTWATHTYSAGLFTTTGAGGWTVAAGDVQHNRYMQLGSTMFWNVQLATTSVIAAAGAELRIALPNSKAATTTVSGVLNGLNNGVAFTGFWYIDASGTYIRMFVDMTGTTNWTVSSDTTSLRFNAVFEVN